MAVKVIAVKVQYMRCFGSGKPLGFAQFIFLIC
jgi:hypothetical protein